MGLQSGAGVNGVGKILWRSDRTDPIAARIAVAGDFLPAGSLTLRAGGWRDAANSLAPHFEDADLAFLNLESALESAGLDARPLAGLGEIVSAPAASLDYLATIKARVIGLANNHSYDFGAEGVCRTRHEIARHGLTPLGAGNTLRSEPDTFVWQGAGKIRIGFWAAARASRDLATRSCEGVEPATLRRASQAHDALKSARASFSIALLHCGCQRTNRVDPWDARLMDRIAAIGFGVVAASHSHRISGAKRLSVQPAAPSFCFYGLGSIASGYIASSLEREGLIVVTGFHEDGSLAQLEVRPVVLADNGFGEVPAPHAARAVLDRFESLSHEIASGSAGRLFYRDLSHGLVRLYLRDAAAAFRASGIGGLFRKAARLRIRHIRRAVYGLIG